MNYELARDKFSELFENKMSENEMREFLVSIYEKSESSVEIAAAASVMREHSIKLPVSEDLREKLIDNCGTGGDGSNTFNISTTVSLVLAGAGCYVAKHGNRSVTSKSGSADMLEALGIRLDLNPEQQVKLLEEANFSFIFAIHHHPAMKYIMPVRKSLNHRTIFNILGPLTNPAGVEKQLVGVFSPDYVTKIIDALVMLESKKAMVVSSLDGLDEISIEKPTIGAYFDGVRVKEMEIDPEIYGMKAKKSDLIGGDGAFNAKITEAILNGEKSPRRDVVLLNAAAALLVDGKVRDIREGIEIASASIDSKNALNATKKIIEISNKL
jgi:anthranilate phosphoribosyltransferase